VREGLLEIFHEEHRQLRPGTALPELKIEFLPLQRQQYDSITEGRLLVRLSDLLEGAPEAVVRAIAHILLARCTVAHRSRAGGAVSKICGQP